MLLIKVTAEQRQHLMDAMDVVIKATGLSGLDKVLPLINAIQNAEEIEPQKPTLIVDNKE